jgi:putative transposase
MSYKLVEDLQKKACPKVAVSQSCRVLEVSRCGYYAHQTAARQRLAEPTVCAQSVHLKAAFAASHKAYGSRRLRTAMAERGQPMGRHRVRTLIKLNGLRPVWRRKFVHTTDSKHGLAVSPNVLNRQFEQALPNRVWVCDITYSDRLI